MALLRGNSVSAHLILDVIPDDRRIIEGERNPYRLFLRRPLYRSNRKAIISGIPASL
jgi:hypothetical protein